jgi:putative endonuclease
MATDARRALGERGEDIAAAHLRARGYDVVERNFRVRSGEIDLVAADRHALVFCEVKTRIATRHGAGVQPLESIHPSKRVRLRRLAREWLRMRPAGSGRPTRARLRFDAIGVVLSPSGELLSLEHIEDAF